MKLFDRLDSLPALSPEEVQLLDSVKSLARDQQFLRFDGHHMGDELPCGKAAHRFRHRGAEAAPFADCRQSGRRIVEFQGIQFLLADLATDLAMCEAWLWHVAGLLDSGAADFGIEASMLKMRASDLAMRIATE